MPVDMTEKITHKILAHYDAYARDLPWRSLPGAPLPDPYRVWLSEIMLQQTTVAAVKPYFETFTRRWPSVSALAKADDADVMAAWAGLGYYARARNLLACARAVVSQHGGLFPSDEVTLRTLPGIGDYTAAAITAIAFGKRAVVVDGNVERVMARFYTVEIAMPAAKPVLKNFADALTPLLRAGDYAQAVMDLGATLCTPRSPKCLLCPINTNCAGKDNPEHYPVKLKKVAKPHRVGRVWWIERDGHVLLIKRPDSGLLGGMRALPSCDWRGHGVADLIAGNWQDVGFVEHIFTHFSLTLSVRHLAVEEDCATALGGQWWGIDRLDQAGLPSVFAKAAQAVVNGRQPDEP
ncbi:MAG: A/G-specific adenine glycosylase [Chakrabartia sp.]